MDAVTSGEQRAPLLMYINDDGDAYLQLQLLPGWMPPPVVVVNRPGGGEVRMRYCGTVGDVFAVMAVGHSQAELGALFGVSQQSFSRYIAGTSYPQFTPEQWALLVHLYRKAERAGG